MRGAQTRREPPQPPQRRSGIWRRVALWALLGAVLVASALCAAWLAPGLRIAGATLRGPRPLTEAAREHVPLGASIALTPLSAIEERMESDPRVARADVRRVWPDHLDIRLTPRNPLAQVRLADGDFGFVDEDGLVFERSLARTDLALLHGEGLEWVQCGQRLPGGKMGVARAAIHQAGAQELAGLQKVDFLVDGRVNLVLAGGAVVKLGHPVHVASKIAVASAALRELSGQQVEYLDVELPDQAVVRLAGAVGG